MKNESIVSVLNSNDLQLSDFAETILSIDGRQIMCAEQSEEHFDEAFRKSIQNDDLVVKVEKIQKELDHLLGFYADVPPKSAIFPEVQRCYSFLKNFKEEHKLSYDVPNPVCEPPEYSRRVYEFTSEEKAIEDYKKDHKEEREKYDTFKEALEKDCENLKKCVSDLKREVNDKE